MYTNNNRGAQTFGISIDRWAMIEHDDCTVLLNLTILSFLHFICDSLCSTLINMVFLNLLYEKMCLLLFLYLCLSISLSDLYLYFHLRYLKEILLFTDIFQFLTLGNSTRSIVKGHHVAK